MQKTVFSDVSVWLLQVFFLDGDLKEGRSCCINNVGVTSDNKTTNGLVKGGRKSLKE